MYFLDRNEFKYDLPPKCLDFIQNIDDELITHYTRAYTRNVKSVISERIAKEFDVPEKNVLLGYGSEDLLKQTIHYYLQEDENLLVPKNSWWYYQQIAEEVGGKTIQFPIHKTSTGFDVHIEDLFELYKKFHPNVILLASPNNPTGNTIGVENLRKIIEGCPDSFIALDEAYWGYTEHGDAHVKEFIENYENVIILRTFSKYYGLPGIRIGFAFINEKNQQFINFANRYLGYNRISEKLAIAALDSEDHYLEIKKRMNEDKERYYKELRDLPEVNVYDTDANFILIKIPERSKEKLKTLLEREEISIKFLSDEGLEHHLRISLAPLELGDKIRSAIKQAVAK